MMENNKVKLSGILDNRFNFSHESYGEKFYTSKLYVQRTSGTYDEIPLLISEDFILEIKN